MARNATAEGGRVIIRRLAVLSIALSLLAGCSAGEQKSCDWRDRRDVDYNAAVKALDSARAHNQHVIENGSIMSKSEVISEVYDSSDQLEVARDKVISMAGAASLAETSCK
jgi:hypothetical protein